MTDYTTYAAFNTLTVNGRISNIDLVNGRNGEFIAVSVITNFMNDDEGANIKFLNSNGLLALYKNGKLPVGRLITLTGHIKSIAETYTNQQGEVVMLKRPTMEMVDVQVPTGGLGAMPKDKVENAVRKTGVVVRPSDAKPAEPVLDETPIIF